MLKDSEITCKRNFYDLKIYLKLILHLHINLDKYRGLQSWYDRNGIYCIEIYLSDQILSLEHSEEYVWKQILSLLDKNI